MTAIEQAVLADEAARADAEREAADMQAIVDAENMVAGFLRRPLEFGEYTDVLRVDVDGLAYPKAVPLASGPASANYRIVEYNAVGYLTVGGHPQITEWVPERRTGYLVDQPTRAVTYTGGWTAGSAPFALLRTIARLAYRLAHPAPLEGNAAGASSVKVGDLAVTWANGAPGGEAAGRELLDAYAPGAADALAQYRWSEDYA
jgi:hypothetical protein